MLTIRIISGERKEQSFELPEISALPAPLVLIREDDILQFKVHLEEYFENLSLVLHEIETPYTRCYKTEENWTYEWLPREKYGFKESFFHNYYGLAELQLVARDLNHSQNPSEFAFFAELQPIEVFAKKINADRVEKMLNFLAQKSGKDLASAIRVTRIKAGHKAGGRTEAFLLERIENNIAFLKSILPSIASNPLSSLHQTTRLVPPNHDTLVDETSLTWISENPDNLLKAFSLDEAVLSYSGEYFTVNKLLESKSKNSTDIYENQILHGFVFVMLCALNDIRSKLSVATNRRHALPPELSGYVSLFSQISKFSSIINKNKIDKCARLIRDLSNIYTKLRQSIPVSKPHMEMPRFTQKSKFNILYRQVFNRSIAWRRYGAPDWSFQDELFSIQSIPKLFEYYLFCVIKGHINDHTSQEISSNDESIIDSDIFQYETAKGLIRLQYEPSIWTVGHNSALGGTLVNTEGWTLKNHAGEVNLSKRGTTGWKSNRRPDIVLEITPLDGRSEIIIIDAKYTDNNKAFLKYLPELTMKYVHGIHHNNSGKNPSRALIVVNPSESPSTRHFHHADYSIYGKTPACPALLVSSIDVSCAHESNSNIRKDLSQLIEAVLEPEKINR